MTNTRAGQIEDAARALLADVRSRYPGEPLRCPHMIRLDELVNGTPPNLEQVIADSMASGNDITAFEIAMAIRDRFPNLVEGPVT